MAFEASGARDATIVVHVHPNGDWSVFSAESSASLLARTSQWLTLPEIASRLEALIVTRGEKGSEIYAGGQRHEIACVPAAAVVDPTGCGDAYRAGLLLALAEGQPLLQGAQLGSVLGSIKIAVQGCQNHRPSRAEIRAQFEQHYGPWPFA